MALVVCRNCGASVAWGSSGCAKCGVVFDEVHCASCGFAARAERFVRPECPRCSNKQLVLVSSGGETVEEVGTEAFVDDGVLADAIERSFSKRDEERPVPEPSGRGGAARRSAPEPPRTRRVSAPEPAHAAAEEPPTAAAPRPKSVQHAPIAARARRRIHFELSPKGQQILRWSAVAVPCLLAAAVATWFLVDTRGRPRLRYGSDAQAPADDPSMLETQAARQYAMALDYYRAGQTEQAINFLRDLVSRFPTTSAARDAREALDRLARGLPLFGDAAPKPDPAKPASHASHTGAASSETEPPKAPERKKPVIGIRKPSAPGETPSGDATPTDREDGSDLRDPPPQGSTLARAEMRPRALPPDFLPVDAAGVHSSGWPIEIVCLKDQSHMMLVPSGVFEMGSAAGAENTQPVHRVRLKAYYIDRYEITLGQYKHFLQQRRLQNSPYRDLSVAAFAALSSDKHPVVGVAWRDANVYAEWAGKTLPTEAQWEKAARGTDGRSVPWGKGRPKWERPREPKQIDPVGSYAWDVSIYGCYDMAGNAWEWCSDWYDPDAYLTHPEDDPQGPKESLPPVEHLDLEKTLRGGSAQWEVTWRAPGGLNEEPLHVGFRCVLDVERIIRPTPTPEPQRSSVPQNAVPVPSGGYKF